MIKSIILIPALAAATAAFSATASATTSHTSSYRFVEMTGEQEVPGPGDPDGVGIFAWRVSGSSLCYVITAHDIDPATSAHIHRGREGVAGPIVVTLKPPSEGFASDCIPAVKRQTADNAETTLTFDELKAITQRPSQFYANVHNEEFPDGAIRGQLDGAD
ncbi:CHRD domain-containing protein [Nonomuraea turkmeniaca]|uniref:CHRD domain-containing protein n=1 Tax=Nonomuraea turkmeniaca TaxID=103838 RepID=A0A5S4FBG6_9ACTN|nr:CHRD domain-containing protein [Nonomuraea turkmeniaca]TMR15066.1 CHRD domain-containing protein [Nonomuraea turkmeniaca]